MTTPARLWVPLVLALVMGIVVAWYEAPQEGAATIVFLLRVIFYGFFLAIVFGSIAEFITHRR
jgi:hypothetical protein